jgi:hypothetical protein
VSRIPLSFSSSPLPLLTTTPPEFFPPREPILTESLMSFTIEKVQKCPKGGKESLFFNIKCNGIFAADLE